MFFDPDHVALLAEALQRLDQGFSRLPSFEAKVDPAALRDVLLRTAERLHDNYPYPHPLYVGQMLKPLRGEQWEAGLKYEPRDRPLAFNAAVYDLREKDRTTSPMPNVITQLDDTRTRGVELEARGRVTPALDLIASHEIAVAGGLACVKAVTLEIGIARSLDGERCNFHRRAAHDQLSGNTTTFRDLDVIREGIRVADAFALQPEPAARRRMDRETTQRVAHRDANGAVALHELELDIAQGCAADGIDHAAGQLLRRRRL